MDVCLDVQKLRWWPFQKRRGPETVAQRPRHPQAASPRCLSVRRPREGQGRLHLTLQHLASLCLPAESKHPAEGVSRSACPPHPHPTGLGVRLPPKWSLGGPALWSSWKSMQNHRNVPGGVLQVQDGGQGWPVEKVWWSGLGWEQLDTAEEGWRRGRPATPGSLGPAARLGAGPGAREPGQTGAALTPSESQRWCKEENSGCRLVSRSRNIKGAHV